MDALLTARCAVEVCHVVDPKAAKKTTAKKTPKPRAKSGLATASTSRAKGKGRATADSVEPESEVEAEQGPIVIDLVDDDDAWVPSTELPCPPPREPTQRRRTVASDELPLFTVPPSPLSEPSRAPRHPPVLAHKRHAEAPLTSSSSKKRKTI